MASFGANYPCFCPVAAEPENARPTYKGEPVQIGRLVKADLSVTLATGELYADNVLAESVAEFASGSIAMETDDMLRWRIRWFTTRWETTPPRAGLAI